MQPQNALVVAAVDPGSMLPGSTRKFSGSVTDQASKAGVEYVRNDFWKRLFVSSGFWGVVGATAGWYWWSKPLHGAAAGAVLGAWSNLSYQTGRVVGYSVAEAQRLEDAERHRSMLGQFIETPGNSKKVPATAGLRSRIAAARKNR